MNRLKKYLNDTLGIDVLLKTLPEGKLKSLPLYLKSLYNFKTMKLYDRDIIVLIQKEFEYLTADQYRKHMQTAEQVFDNFVVLILESIEAYNRKRLIEKRIAFIIPGKQMFIPQLMIDLRQIRHVVQKKKEKIQPAAQCLLIYNLLKENIEGINLKMIAEKLNYTPMTVTRAAIELAEKKLCRIEGKKDKNIVFAGDRKTTWKNALPYLQNPIRRKLYIDDQLDKKLIYETGDAALSFYTNMAGGPGDCYAISNTDYLNLKKHKKINAVNKVEGRVCLEIWNYDPGILAEKGIVDPLSLYLTFRDTDDERIEKEIENMVNRLW